MFKSGEYGKSIEIRVSLTRFRSPDDDVNSIFGEISCKISLQFPCRVQCIFITQLDVQQLFFVPTLNLHFPKIEEIGIDALKSVRILSNNGLLQLTNGLFATDFNGERVFVTVDPAVQGYCAQYPRLRLVRLVGLKEVGGIEILFCVMRRSRRGCRGICRGIFRGGLVLLLLLLEGRQPSCWFSLPFLRWHQEIIKEAIKDGFRGVARKKYTSTE